MPTNLLYPRIPESQAEKCVKVRQGASKCVKVRQSASKCVKNIRVLPENFQEIPQNFQEIPDHCPYAIGVFKAKCSCGRIYYRVAGCNREVCEYCGRKNSPLHKQTFKRWIGKARWLLKNFGYVGYLVITFPEEIREKLKNQKKLREIMGKVKRVLREFGATHIKMRWHWAGDKGGRWHPHLNIIVNIRFFEDIGESLKKRLKEEFQVDNLVINHQYLRKVNKLVHCIKYITRPTLLLIEDENERWEIWENVVKGFRNDAWMGKWQEDNLTIEDVKAVILKAEKEWQDGDWKRYVELCLDVGICPSCGAKIKWKWQKMEIWKLEEYSSLKINGYYLSDGEFT